MGDVIHNFAVVSDLARIAPDIQIDWATEAPYVPLVRLHPAVKHVFPVRLRAVKKRWSTLGTWRDLATDRGAIRAANHAAPYDLVIDTQGLVKSAIVAGWAGRPIAGFDRDTAREPLAARWYQQHIHVPRNQHAVERNRQLAAGALNYAVPAQLEYGIAAQTPRPTWLSSPRYAVLLHATSRENKAWPVAHWVMLGRELHARGIDVVLPWGSAAEHAVSEQLARELPGACVPPAMSLDVAATVLAGAVVVVGVDTGLAHLAVALGRPTIGIYVSTTPALTGLHGGASAINLGGGTSNLPQPPTFADVWARVQPFCEAP
jgi:heptosyltransferase I